MFVGGREFIDFVFFIVVCRWEVIAAFIGQHVTGSNKNARDVLSKAKELQKNGKFHQGKVTKCSSQRFWCTVRERSPLCSFSLKCLQIQFCGLQSLFALLPSVLQNLLSVLKKKYLWKSWKTTMSAAILTQSMTWTRPMCDRSVQCIISRPSRHFSGKVATWCHEELIFPQENTLCCVNTHKICKC